MSDANNEPTGSTSAGSTVPPADGMAAPASGPQEKLKVPKLPPARPNPPPMQRGRAGMLQRRAARIRAEIDRNRTEGPKIPTWVLAVALVVILGGWIALIVFS